MAALVGSDGGCLRSCAPGILMLCQTCIDVPDYCTCGAQLPPDARFCHKCGKPQYDYPGTEEKPGLETPAPLPPPLPTAVAGPPEISFRNGTAVRIGFMVALLALTLILGVVKVLPSSAWAILGFFCAGVAAVTWYTRRTGHSLPIRGGARLGWMTGIFCFAIALVIFSMFLLALTNPAAVAALKSDPSMRDNPASQQMLKMFTDPNTAPMAIVTSIVTMFIMLTTLPMLGGALGAKLSERRA